MSRLVKLLLNIGKKQTECSEIETQTIKTTLSYLTREEQQELSKDIETLKKLILRAERALKNITYRIALP